MFYIIAYSCKHINTIIIFWCIICYWKLFLLYFSQKISTKHIIYKNTNVLVIIYIFHLFPLLLPCNFIINETFSRIPSKNKLSGQGEHFISLHKRTLSSYAPCHALLLSLTSIPKVPARKIVSELFNCEGDLTSTNRVSLGPMSQQVNFWCLERSLQLPPKYVEWQLPGFPAGPSYSNAV